MGDTSEGPRCRCELASGLRPESLCKLSKNRIAPIEVVLVLNGGKLEGVARAVSLLCKLDSVSFITALATNRN